MCVGVLDSDGTNVMVCRCWYVVSDLVVVVGKQKTKLLEQEKSPT